MQVDTSYLRACDRMLEALASDVSPVLSFTAAHLEDFSRWGDGRLVGIALGDHGAYLATTEANLVATRTLLGAAAGALSTIARRYDQTDADQHVSLSGLFKDLDPQSTTPPITGDTARSGGSPTLPSLGLAEPGGPPDANPIFMAILQWPDYLSFSWWLRWLINKGFQLCSPGIGGGDIFEWLWTQVGGDWDKVYAAGEAFGEIGEYFARLGDVTLDEAIAMFAGWNEGSAAEAAGQFFAEAVAAFDAQVAPYADLELKYQQASGASYMLCQAAYSGLDALADQAIASALGVSSIAEGFAALFDMGTTAPLAVASAVAAFIAELSAIWGAAVAAVLALGGLSLLAQAGGAEITLVPIPEA